MGGAVVSGGAGSLLLAGTNVTPLSEVTEVGGEGIELMEVGETTGLLAEEAAAAAAAATGESAAAAAASTLAAEAAVASGGAAAAEGVGLVSGAAAVESGLLTAAALTGPETAGLSLVVLGAAAGVVAGGAAIYDHSDEIGNSFNDLGNEISKTWDSIF